MKNKKNALLILLLLSASLLISCNSNTSKKTEQELPDNTPTKPLIFQLNAEDISSVSIFNFERNHVSGEFQKKDDIKELTQILNDSSTNVGNVTDDLYRKLIIHMNNTDTQILLFGGNGIYFKDTTTRHTYMLDPTTKTQTLNQLIDRLEKEYSNR
ncbi:MULTISPECIES: hypothetical protein [Paenibacillus]|jgi:hypothetical protein|uniref:Lipoprotein n=2 Tax=Paenibacillus lactis TaxID=228574 RepID=G4HPU9_9BACL|nr:MULTISPECIES: hypothetical protein [Paenibacillus]EHB47116.1 hypothetical protein PaelaDRAFT_6010 [Paenibacillus lactis 154]MBP1896299.1 hypothetical protein [Paenibacillus lactis]MCM3497264.1 hypothetical protein [Paenibacillus lactis]HAG00534.1 hypothetical protein [Paenibacillus lactis]